MSECWCGKPVLARGLCQRHYHRARDGSPAVQPWDIDKSPRYAIHRRPDVSYYTAHARPKQLWGAAKQYPCVECGNAARDWAYDGTDESELYRKHVTSSGECYMKYSAWPEFYKPMCARCHMALDGAIRKRELMEYREWRHRTGMTLAEASERLGL